MILNHQESNQISERLLSRRRGTLVEPFGFLLDPWHSLGKRQGYHGGGIIPAPFSLEAVSRVMAY